MDTGVISSSTNTRMNKHYVSLPYIYITQTYGFVFRYLLQPYNNSHTMIKVRVLYIKQINSDKFSYEVLIVLIAELRFIGCK